MSLFSMSWQIVILLSNLGSASNISSLLLSMLEMRLRVPLTWNIWQCYFLCECFIFVVTTVLFICIHTSFHFTYLLILISLGVISFLLFLHLHLCCSILLLITQFYKTLHGFLSVRQGRGPTKCFAACVWTGEKTKTCSDLLLTDFANLHGSDMQ